MRLHEDYTDNVSVDRFSSVTDKKQEFCGFFSVGSVADPTSYQSKMMFFSLWASHDKNIHDMLNREQEKLNICNLVKIIS